MPQSQSVARTFLVITDGYVDVEAEAFDLVRANLGQANLFAFGIGSSVNRHLIEGLARCGQGEPFIATDPDMAPDVAAKFRTYVSTPMLTRVKVEYQGIDAYDTEPTAIPDLLADRPLMIFGKWRGPAQGRIVVSGLSGTAPYRAEHDVSQAKKLPNADGLSRLWARSRIAQIGDLQELRPTDERKAQITNLGLTYNLLTRFTSFVAVDDVVRRTTPDLKTIKQPLPLPAGVENSAVGNGGTVPAAPEPSTYALVAVGMIILAVASRRRKARRASAS
jgi:Ca-activated chloride channel family protein